MSKREQAKPIGPGMYAYQHPRPVETPEEAECYRQSLQNWMEGVFPPKVYLDPAENAEVTLQIYPLYQWMKQAEGLGKLNRELAAGVAAEQQELQEELLTARMLLLKAEENLRFYDKQDITWGLQAELREFLHKVNSKPPRG